MKLFDKYALTDVFEHPETLDELLQAVRRVNDDEYAEYANAISSSRYSDAAKYTSCFKIEDDDTAKQMILGAVQKEPEIFLGALLIATPISTTAFADVRNVVDFEHFEQERKIKIRTLLKNTLGKSATLIEDTLKQAHQIMQKVSTTDISDAAFQYPSVVTRAIRLDLRKRTQSNQNLELLFEMIHDQNEVKTLKRALGLLRQFQPEPSITRFEVKDPRDVYLIDNKYMVVDHVFSAAESRIAQYLKNPNQKYTGIFEGVRMTNIMDPSDSINRTSRDLRTREPVMTEPEFLVACGKAPSCHGVLPARVHGVKMDGDFFSHRLEISSSLLTQLKSWLMQYNEEATIGSVVALHDKSAYSPNPVSFGLVTDVRYNPETSEITATIYEADTSRNILTERKCSLEECLSLPKLGSLHAGAFYQDVLHISAKNDTSALRNRQR